MKFIAPSAVLAVIATSFIGGVAVARWAESENQTPVETVEAAPWNCSGGYVSLTYDDGPTEYTLGVADALEARDMTATFFVTGEAARKNPEIVARLARQHQIGNHSDTHVHLTRVAYPTGQIADAQQAIEDAGVTAEFFRPPFGDTNTEVREIATQLGLTEVIWTLDTSDWRGGTEADILARLADIEAGDVVLMHDQSLSDVEAVAGIEDLLRERSLCTAPLAQSEEPIEAWEGLAYYAEPRP